MSLIVVSQAQDGVTGVNAASINTPVNTIANDYNGNITDANIASNAAIAGSKISYLSVANPYKFSVYRNSAQTPAGALIGYDTKVFDTGTNFSTSTSLFTAPRAGFYQFNIFTTFATNTAPNEVFTQLQKNGSTTSQPFLTDYSFTNATSTATNSSILLQLSTNDTIGVTAGGVALVVGPQRSAFSGFFVSAT